MTDSNLKVKWIDSGREPKCPPDPAYPNGIDLCVPGEGPTCYIDLPYPAKRCGFFIVECSLCKQSVAITTAGRPDDPRSLTIPCKLSEIAKA